jgi:hypothetical protein
MSGILILKYITASRYFPFLCANSKKRAIYECVVMQPYREEDKILDAEGELDNDSDDLDFDLNEFKAHRDSDLWSVTSSTHAEPGSPMLIDEKE